MNEASEDIEFQRRVLRAFDELVEVPRDEREGRLARLRAEAPDIADEVAAMLAVDDESKPLDLHDLPAVDRLVELQGSAPEPGQKVGGYELLRRVGSGGMGHVFEALQERPRRRVALKMLRFGLDSERSRRRFEVESEILARLRHPGIAQIFEAGVHVEDAVTGRREVPYFALEFVEGARSIVAYASEKGLPRPAVLELFAAVCDAVHHGHQRGVIHRDLKPANVLVGLDGAPKVIDFGVARATGQETEGRHRTRTSEIVGTLSAMSPEQLAGDPGDIDLRSDVYALGVLLYELLAGRLPYEITGLGLHDATRRIVEEPPLPLRDVVPELDRDLATIAHTALAKDREARYPTVLEMAEDIRRYLRHEPIRAQAPSLLRRMALFVRRHRAAVGTAGVVGVLLVAGGWFVAQLATGRRAAEREAESLGDALAGFSQDVTFGFLDELARLGDNTRTRAQMIEAAVERLESIEAGAADDSDTLAALADAYRRLGDLLGHPYRPNLGDRDGAERALRRAEALLAELRERDPDSLALRVSQVHTEISLGALATDQRGLSGAREHALEAIEMTAELLELAPDDPGVRLVRAYALFLDGASQHMNPDAMTAAFADAEAIYRELVVELPEHHGVFADLASLLNSGGEADMVFGRLDEALAKIEEAGALLRRALELSPGNRGYRSALMGLI